MLGAWHRNQWPSVTSCESLGKSLRLRLSFYFHTMELEYNFSVLCISIAPNSWEALVSGVFNNFYNCEFCKETLKKCIFIILPYHPKFISFQLINQCVDSGFVADYALSACFMFSFLSLDICCSVITIITHSLHLLLVLIHLSLVSKQKQETRVFQVEGKVKNLFHSAIL